MQNFDPDKDNIWFVEADGQLKGSVAISHLTETEAPLRWYLVEPSWRAAVTASGCWSRRSKFLSNQPLVKERWLKVL